MTNYAHGSSAANQAKLLASKNRLLGNSITANALSGVTPTVYLVDFPGSQHLSPYAEYITSESINLKPGYRQELETYLGQFGQTFDADDSVVYIDAVKLAASNGSTFPLQVHDTGGSLFDIGLDRIIFHELIHAATIRYEGSFGAHIPAGPGAASSAFEPFEQIAVNAENIIFVQAFGGSLRASHNGGFASQINVGIQSFQTMTGTPSFNIGMVDGSIAAIFSERGGGFTFSKYLFARDTNNLGKSVEFNLAPAILHNYILNELKANAPGQLINRDDGLNEFALTALFDTAHSNVEEKVAIALAGLELLDTNKEALRTTTVVLPDHLRGLLADLPKLDQVALRGISTDGYGHSDQKVYTTLITSGGTLQEATYMPVAAASGQASVLIGAAGFQEYTLNFSQRLDDLRGSGGGDLLIAGDSSSSGDSLLYGEGGKDIIVSGTGKALIDGGEGNDLIIVGSGGGAAMGGDGNDVLTFLDQQTAVEVDLDQGSAILHTRGFGDVTQGQMTVRVSRFEMIIGTEQADHFIGGGSGVILSGGLGADTFVLSRGDVAIGGDGADIFYVNTTVNDPLADILGISPQDYFRSNNVSILDFNNAEDKLYVNGVLFTGSSQSGRVVEPHAGFHAGNHLFHNAVNLIGASSYRVNYPVFTGNDDFSQYGAAAVRDVHIEKGGGNYAGWDRIVFSAFDFAGGPDFETEVDYDERLSILLPSLGSGTINFSSSGVTGGQLVRGGLGNQPYLASDAFIVNGVLLGFDLREFEVPSQGEYAEALAVGQLHGTATSGIIFRSDDTSALAEELLNGIMDPDEPTEPEGGNPIGPGPTITIPAIGSPDRILVYRNGGAAPAINVFSNDGVTGGTPILQLFGGQQMPAFGNLSLTSWWGTVTINAAGLASATLDEGLLASETVSTGEQLDSFIYVATGVYSSVAIVLGGDRVAGTSGNDTLQGGVADDLLEGGDGGDSLAGGAGNDLLAGGGGNDQYLIAFQDGVDTVIESGGTDLVEFGAGVDPSEVLVAKSADGLDYVLGVKGQAQWVILKGAVTGGAHAIEAVRFNDNTQWTAATLESLATGGFSGAELLIGGGADDVLSGSHDGDMLLGEGGSDTLSTSGAGAVLAGGSGDDLYLVSSADTKVVEFVHDGIDEVRTTLAAYTLAANVEILTFLGTADATGTGNALDNLIIGGDGDDSLSGGAGNDVLDGGAGADDLFGGTGHDVYRVGAGDSVTELANEGFDRVETGLANYLLGANIEDLRFTGTGDFTGTGNALDNRLRGGDGDDELSGGGGNDILEGGAGADLLTGGEGDDLYTVDDAGDVVVEAAGEGSDTIRSAIDFALGANFENLTYSGSADFIGIGNELDNEISGGIGNDVIDGGSGADLMRGGTGDDYYLVDDAGDVVAEELNAGFDYVETNLDEYALGDNVEALYYVGAGAFVGVGNDLDNEIVGGEGDDELFGGGGDDLLFGEGGANILRGGAGNDVYFASELDEIVEELGGGTDTLAAFLYFGTFATFTLAENVENLSLSGEGAGTLLGNALDNVLAGGDGDDFLDGGAGADTLIGGAGGDIYVIVDNEDEIIEDANSAGIDTILTSFASYTLGDFIEGLEYSGSGSFTGIGNALDNVIRGGALADQLDGGLGNDLLDGGEGADQLTGGTGDDTYVVDEAGDVIVEAAGEGTDTVVTTLSSYVLANELENLTYDGNADFAGTGNAFSNRIVSGLGNDQLDGGGGADIMAGGAGDDLYYADSEQDQIEEDEGAGYDLVRTTASSFALSQNVEALEYTGSDDFTGFGNDGDNLIVGGAGNDRLTGGHGTDRIEGGLGDDLYFNSQSESVTIVDTGGIDTVQTFMDVDDVSVTIAANGEDYVLTEAGTGRQIIFVGMVNGGSDVSIERILFQSGAEWDAETLANPTLYTEAVTLVGTFADDALNGGIGSDVITALGGNDTVHGGDGHDRIVGNFGNDILFGDAGRDWIHGNSDDDQIFGGAGDDELFGDFGADIISGGSGNDILSDEEGSDIYRFASGDGRDRITDTDGTDAIEFAAGIAPTDIVVSTSLSGRDYILSFANGDRLTLIGAATLAANVIEEIRFDDNTVWTPADLAALSIGPGGTLLSGTAGNDVLAASPGEAYHLVGLAGDDRLTGANEEDLLEGGADNDELDGGAADDQLLGGDGDDLLRGGSGADRMEGGAGDDVYLVDDDGIYTNPDDGDRVIETAGAGFDTVYASVDFVLPDHVEALVVVNGLAGQGTGNALANRLTASARGTALYGLGGADQLFGQAGNDSLFGGDGDDELVAGDGHDGLDGGSGADSMTGGRGDDTYHVDDAGDAVTEAAGEGLDQVVAAIDYTLGDHLEMLRLEGAASVGTGNALANYIEAADDVASALSGLGGDDELFGSALNDQLNGGDGHDRLRGRDGDDGLDGGDGDDILDGGAGADMLVGGLGDDTYIVDDAGDVVVEGSAAGDDVVYASVDFTLSANLEWLFLSGAAQSAVGNDLANVIHGNVELASHLQGLGGDDLLYGGLGDDLIEGGSGINLMFGGAGDDQFSASGTGNEVDGGAGTDRLNLNGTRDDYSVERNGERYTVTSLTGQVSFTLRSVETLYFSGENQTVAIDELLGIYGTPGNDALVEGNDFGNRIYGLAGNDLLRGKGGNDLLDGGQGADVMEGGLGNDVYIVDDAGDLVSELAGYGNDEVRTTLAGYTLAVNVERLTGLLSTGQALTGNSLANIITGGAGADSFNGGLGNDTVSWSWSQTGVSVDLLTGATGGEAAGDTFISIENLTGGAGADTLSGTSAANILDGGAGADVMTGRGGNDIYYVDHASDSVIELSGQGSDEIRTALAALTLAANVEALRYVGAGAFTGTGNELNNSIYGGAGNDTLSGGAGYDSLIGGGGDDQLYGGAEGDVLDGGAGADRMEGGTGSDNYLVDNAGDLVVELAGEGVDLVYATLLSYTLTDEVENLTGNNGNGQTLTGNALANLIWASGGADTIDGGAGNDELRGNHGDDVIQGGDGDDLIVGGTGIDVLTGGAGADIFRFSNFDNGSDGYADIITDFLSGTDRIDLSGVDADIWSAGVQHFTFIGTAAFSGTAGELRYSVVNGNVVLQGDFRGDGGSDLEIVLSGNVAPLVSDFIL